MAVYVFLNNGAFCSYFFLGLIFLIASVRWILIFQIPLILCSLYGIAQDRFLAYSPEEHPVVLQIGGNNLENLAKATQLANAYRYDEINFKYVL